MEHLLLPRIKMKMKGFTFIIVAGLWINLYLAQTSAGQSVYENYTFTTLAGPPEGGSGSRDGFSNVARFSTPGGVAEDSAGNIYVADTANNTIRKITPLGLVSTLAGLAGQTGTNDGVGAAARFNSPYGVAVDASGDVFVADTGNHAIREISPGGLVTTFAGLPGVSGTADGTGSAARFNAPFGVTLDGSGNLFVADTFNNTIREITASGVVTTFAGTPGVQGFADKKGTSAKFTHPVSTAFDREGNLYVADTGNHVIRKIAPNAAVTTLAGLAGNPGTNDGTNDTARFNNPYGITVGSDDNIYITDTFNDTIRKITPSGVVTTFAGAAGSADSTDATGNDARFNAPVGIVAEEGTNFLVGDSGNDNIRRVSAGAVVTTFAGVANNPGSTDGNLSVARFNFPSAVAVDKDNNVYVSDFANHTIRKISTNGEVITLAGSAGVSGTNDGSGLAARFNNPVGLVVGDDGTVFVADTFNHTIRKITPTGDVTTIAGTPGEKGSTNGIGLAAQFNEPFGIALDGNGNLYVSDNGNNVIRRITPDGNVSTFAGTAGVNGTNDGVGPAAEFSSPEGIAMDGDGNLYVADSGNDTIRKITPDGTVTTLAGAAGVSGSADGTGAAAKFNGPFGIAVDASGNVYVSDKINATIRKVTPTGGVTTLAGAVDVLGNDDGTGADAHFRGPEGLAVDNLGNVYVADGSSQSIRKGFPALPDEPFVDLPGGHVGVTRHFGITNLTTTSWSWTLARFPGASSASLFGTNSMNPTFKPDVEDIYVVRFQGWDNAGRTALKYLTIYADDTAPGVTVTNPAPGQVVSNSMVTVRGTATDNLGLSNVWLQVNGGPRLSATGTANWSQDVQLAQGTNVISVYAQDFAGNFSTTNTFGLTYILSAPLTVQINGGGTVTPNFNGVLLEIGKTYSMTAQAGSGCAFVNWTDNAGNTLSTTPTLTFVMQSNLTFIANFTDPIRPTLAITLPQKSMRISNAVFTATGTAADNGQLAAVWYRLNGADWIQATNTSNWAAGLTLTQSANTLDVYAIDTFNNVSPTNSVAFTYVPSSRLTVLTSGQGTLSPNFNGSVLENGKTFTVTAKPGFNYIFKSWTDNAGNTLSTAPALTFVAQSNMTFQVNFVLNPFVPLIGPFAGLFYDTNNIAVSNSGYFSATVTGQGAFSAKLQPVSGKSISFSGQFSLDGVFSNTVAPKGGAPFIIQLKSETANGSRITGSIGSAGWTSSLLAIRADYSVVNPAPERNNQYTLVIPGGDDSTVEPAGNGYGNISVSVSGNISFKGVLGEGSKAAQNTFLSQQGLWPLYISPYKGQGAIFGWMTFSNEANSDLSGLLYWVRLPQANAKLYPAGFNFTTGIEAVGSAYSFTNGAPLLNLPGGGMAILQQGNPLQSFTNNFTLGSDNKVASSDGLNVKITAKSGLFKGSARDPNSGSTVPISGILLQKQNAAYGLFLEAGQSGAVSFGQ